MQTPSPVLHLRSLPLNTTSNELLPLFSAFIVKHLICLANGTQALIEFNTVEDARNCLEYHLNSNNNNDALNGQLGMINGHPQAYNANGISPRGQLHGQQFFIQYSKRRKLKPPPSSEPFPTSPLTFESTDSHLPKSLSPSFGQHQTTSTFAAPLGSTSFSTPRLSKAYCAPMILSKSTKTAFENPNLSSSQVLPTPVSPVLLFTILMCRVPIHLDHIRTICSPFGAVLRIVLFQRAETSKGLVEMDSIESAIALYNSLDGKDIFANCCHLRVSFSNLSRLYVRTNTEIARDYTHLSSLTIFPNTQQSHLHHPQFHGHSQSPIHPIISPQNSFVSHSNMLIPFSQMQVTPQHQALPITTPVLLVMNLRADVTLHQLFTLFSLFGDVEKIKLLFQKRGHALIQFTTAVMAAAAYTHLNNFSLYSRPIRIAYSKYNAISVSPRDEPNKNDSSNGIENFRDYSSGKLHRYRHSFDPRKLVAPSVVLYIARLPLSISRVTLLSLFPPEVASKSSLHFFTANGRKQAFVRFASVDDALEVLFELQDKSLEDIRLKLSFSARPPESLMNEDNEANELANNSINHNAVAIKAA